MAACGIDIPDWLSTDYRTRGRGRRAVLDRARRTSSASRSSSTSWPSASSRSITIVLVWGIRESARFNAVMVGDQDHGAHSSSSSSASTASSPRLMRATGQPFCPERLGGALAPAPPSSSSPTSASTPSRPSPKRRKNPQRDLPIGIIASLVICTVFYVVVAAVFTGLISYPDLQAKLATEQAEPLTMALQHAAPQRRGGRSRIVAFGVGHRAHGGPARLPARPAADLLLDGPRRPAAPGLREGPPEVPHAARHDDPDGHLRRRSSPPSPASTRWST